MRLSTKKRTTYAKVAGKYQDVVALESSVAELHQMFIDFALLTEQQGELLDQIEFQVGKAADHVEVANEETYQAIEYQKAIRKKQWYVTSCFCSSVVAFAFALLYVFCCGFLIFWTIRRLTLSFGCQRLLSVVNFFPRF